MRLRSSVRADQLGFRTDEQAGVARRASRTMGCRLRAARSRRRELVQPVPAVSLELIEVARRPAHSRGDRCGRRRSLLADNLVRRGFSDVTVLDIAGSALDASRQRIGARAECQLRAGRPPFWRPSRTYDLWHDRAVYHFLVTDEDRETYAGLCGKRSFQAALSSSRPSPPTARRHALGFQCFATRSMTWGRSWAERSTGLSRSEKNTSRREDRCSRSRGWLDGFGHAEPPLCRARRGRARSANLAAAWPVALALCQVD